MVKLKKMLLWTAIGGLASTGVFALYAVLAGDFREFQLRVLATTFTVAVSCMLGLAAAVAGEHRVARYYFLPAMVFTLLSFISYMQIIWLRGSEREWGQFGVTATILAFGFTSTSLLRMARIKRSFQWVTIATQVSIACLSLLLIGLVWDMDSGSSDLRFRGIAALSILSTLGCLIVPILHRLTAVDPPVEDHEVFQEIKLGCPRCQQVFVARLGKVACPQCQLVLSIKIESLGDEPRSRGRHPQRRQTASAS